MPFSYAIHKGIRLVIFTATERITFDDVQEFRKQLTNDPDFRPDYDLLNDLRDVTAFDISAQEATVIAQKSVFSETSRRVTVATRPDIFGMNRLIQIHRQMGKRQEKVEVFYTLDEALGFLGLPSLPE